MYGTTTAMAQMTSLGADVGVLIGLVVGIVMGGFVALLGVGFFISKIQNYLMFDSNDRYWLSKDEEYTKKYGKDYWKLNK